MPIANVLKLVGFVIVGGLEAIALRTIYPPAVVCVNEPFMVLPDLERFKEVGCDDGWLGLDVVAGDVIVPPEFATNKD